jgi:acyl carrier protein
LYALIKKTTAVKQPHLPAELETLQSLWPTHPRPPAQNAYVAPCHETERTLADLWQKVLGIDRVGINDNFFQLGGHSLLAVRLFAHIEKAFARKLPLATLFQAPTVEQLACILRQEGWSAPLSCLVAIQPGGSKPPFFCIHGPGGHVLSYYDLARHLGPNQPVYGLQALGLDGNHTPLTQIEDMAAHYIKEMRSLHPEGPYFLGGLALVVSLRSKWLSSSTHMVRKWRYWPCSMRTMKIIPHY